MSKLVIKITSVNGCDIPSLEDWLEQQAAKGQIGRASCRERV